MQQAYNQSFYADGLSSAYKRSNASTIPYDSEKYEALLQNVFIRIKASGARNLVINLRSNTGGYSALGNELINMFNAKPYKGYSSKWKRSLQLIAHSDTERRHWNSGLVSSSISFIRTGGRFTTV